MMNVQVTQKPLQLTKSLKKSKISCWVIDKWKCLNLLTLQTSQVIVHNILHEYLHMKKLLTRWVPYLLIVRSKTHSNERFCVYARSTMSVAVLCSSHAATDQSEKKASHAQLIRCRITIILWPHCRSRHV